MRATIDAGLLRPGFSSPVFDSQATFRRILDAMAYPGRPQTIDRDQGTPAGFCRATAAVCLTLLDFETTLWMDSMAATDEAAAYVRFHCGAPLTQTADAASFAVIANPESMPRLADFAVGEVLYPDRSTTLILQVPALTGGRKMVWSGPGVRGSITTSIVGLPVWFWDDWEHNGDLYPLGIDIIFTAGDSLIGLPRSIRVER